VPLAAVTLTQREWDGMGKRGMSSISWNKRAVAAGMMLEPLDEADRACAVADCPGTLLAAAGLVTGSDLGPRYSLCSGPRSQASIRRRLIKGVACRYSYRFYPGGRQNGRAALEACTGTRRAGQLGRTAIIAGRSWH